ncbi:MAG: acyltransferase family protein [Actinomycetes bacterium]
MATTADPSTPTRSTPSTIVAFPCLDGVRAIAAGAVLAAHLAVSLHRTYPGAVDARWLAHVDALSRFGVLTFFMLSGFLLYRPFVLAQLSGTPAPRPVKFWIRRGVRILPGYWVALAGAIALGVGVYTRPSAADYVTSFALLQNYRAYGFFSSGLFVAWTLVIEVSFYAVLPGIAAIADRIGRRRGRRAVLRANVAVLGGLATIGVATRAVAIFVLGASASPTRTWFPISNLRSWLPSYLDVFACGMALAVVCAWRETGGGVPRVVSAFTRRPWAAWCMVGLMVVASARAGLPTVPGDLAIARTPLFVVDEIAIVAALFLLIPAALPGARPGGVRRALAWRTVAIAGTLAFGIYLWQQAAILLLERWYEDGTVVLGAGPSLVAASAMTIVAAYASFVLVEAPARDLALRATGRVVPLRTWWRIGAATHGGDLDRFVWSGDAVLPGERIVVATAILGATGFVLVLPAIRAALG